MQESAYSNAHTGFQSSMYNDPTSFLGSTHSAAASAGMYGLASASVDSNRLSAPSAAPYLPAPLPSSSAVDDGGAHATTSEASAITPPVSSPTSAASASASAVTPPMTWSTMNSAGSGHDAGSSSSDPYSHHRFGYTAAAAAAGSIAAREAPYLGAAAAFGSYAAYAQNMMSWNNYNAMASFQSLQRAGVTYGKNIIKS